MSNPVDTITPPIEVSLPRAPAFGATRAPLFSSDRILALLTRIAALIILVMLAGLVAVLVVGALPAIGEYGARFLVNPAWTPAQTVYQFDEAAGDFVYDEFGDRVIESVIPANFGALAVIWGTAASSAIALLIAVPLSFGAALALVRIVPRIMLGGVSFLIEFLAAIPSIAYGLWGLFVVVPFLQGNVRIPTWLGWLDAIPLVGRLFVPSATLIDPATAQPYTVFVGLEPLLRDTLGQLPGVSWLFYTTDAAGTVIARPLVGADLFCGGIVLAIMIIPIVTAISRDVLAQVPRGQLEGTVALGATWWQSSVEMLRYGRAALFGAVMLGLARAAGETMAITMVIGNKIQIAGTPFAPAQTMSSLLALQFPEADQSRPALLYVALVLLVMSLVFNVVARYLVVGKDSASARAH